jgi:hypothetical protein
VVDEISHSVTARRLYAFRNACPADKSERAESQGNAHQHRFRTLTEPDGKWKGDQEERRGDTVDGA